MTKKNQKLNGNKEVTQMIEHYSQQAVVKLLVAETLKLFTYPNRLMEDKAPLDKHVAIAYIGEFIKQLLLEVVSDRPLAFEDKELEEYTLDNYKETKHELMDTIAKAFSIAIGKFSGQKLQFICEITLAPGTEKDN